MASDQSPNGHIEPQLKRADVERCHHECWFELEYNFGKQITLLQWEEESKKCAVRIVKIVGFEGAGENLTHSDGAIRILPEVHVRAHDHLFKNGGLGLAGKDQ